MTTSDWLFAAATGLCFVYFVLGFRAYRLRTPSVRTSDPMLLGDPLWPFYDVYEPEAWRLVVTARILLAIIATLFFVAYVLPK
jgi:succinate dehydrogenase hydrophobic anchor subunit